MTNTKVVAVFHDNDLLSGATRSFFTNIEYLKKVGCSVIALIPNKKGDLAEKLSSIGIQVIKRPYGGNVYRATATGVKYYYGYLRCLFKTIISFFSALIVGVQLVKEGVDVVYSNTSTIYFGYWVSRILRKKHIWHFREFGFEDQESKRIFYRLFINMARHSYAIITISKALQKHFEKDGIESVMLYDDLDASYINKTKTIHEGINVLLTGTLMRGKGQIVAVEAMKYLNKKYPNLTLYLAGKDRGYKDYLERIIAKESIKNVVFCGAVTDMISLRQKMDIALVCSTSEAFGRIIIEDMLSYNLIIASNSGSVPELLGQKYGFVFQPGHAEDLADKIDQALCNDSLVNKIKEDAFLFASRFCNLETAKKIFDIISLVQK